MKKPTIISGSQGSGKASIVNAIFNQYDPLKTFEVSAEYVTGYNGRISLRRAIEEHDVVHFDGCRSIEEILDIDLRVQQELVNNPKPAISIVYSTQKRLPHPIPLKFLMITL